MSLDEALAGMKQQEEQVTGVAATIDAATRYSPDQMARYNRLAKITQIDPLRMAEDPEVAAAAEARAKASELDLDSLINTHPFSAHALGQLPVAALTHDDIGGLTALETAMRGYMRGSAAIVSAAPKAFAGSIGLARGVNEVFLMPYTRAVSGALGTRDPGEAMDAYLARLQASGRAGEEALMGRAQEGLGETGSAVVGGLQSLGGMGMALAGGASVAPTVEKLGGAVMGFMIAPMAGEEYSKAREKGLSPTSAAGFATTQGSIEYLTEKGPTGALFKATKLGSPVFTSMVNGAREFLIKEIGGEQAATLLQDANEQAVLHPEKTISDYISERPSAAYQTLIATLVAGGGAIATSKGMQKLLDEDAQGAQRAELAHAGLSEISQAAANSKLRERGPEMFKVFMQEMADDSGLEAIYVDAAVMRDAISQLPPEAQASLQESMPELQDQIVEGVNLDGMVRIATGDYATHIAGTDLDAAVLPAARVEPEGYTFAESQDFYAGEQDSMQRVAEEFTEEEQQARVQQEEAQQVKQLVLDQLTSAARYRPEVNEKLAELRKSWYVNRAAALGMTPTELYSLMPSVTIGPDEAPIDTLEQPAASPRAQALLREADVEEAAAAKRVRTGDPQLAEGHKAKAAELRSQADVAQREDDEINAKAREARDAKLASSNYGYRQRDAARVATPDALKDSNVKDLLRMTDWTILTAENPAAQALSPEENAARNEELKAELSKRGLQFEEVKGKYGANEENSIAVFGISREDASALGQMFGQESVLTRDGLVFPDDTVIPARKVETFDSAPKDNYTRVPSTGAVFSVDLDFGKRVPLNKGRLGEVRVEGTHFSRSARMVLDGAAYGTGLKGEEAARVNQPGADSRLSKRLYFYVDEGQGVTPEAGVGSERHEVVLTNIYDLAKNPLGIPTANSNAMEAAILDAGFDGYYAAGRFNNQGAAVVLGQATKGVVVDLPPEGKLFQSAFHGSPFAFDKFSMQHIGTGEGAQAYGWGLYFAGEKKVAEWYKQKLTESTFLKEDGSEFDTRASIRNVNVRVAFEKSGGDTAVAIARARQSIKNIPGTDGARAAQRDIETLTQLEKEGGASPAKGRLYEVDIPDAEEYLLWDEPLSAQSEKVKAALYASGYTKDADGMTGEELYLDTVGDLAGGPETENPQELASKLFNQLGIRGIKYLDGASRDRGGELSYNYVIFDEADVQIVETYLQQIGDKARGFFDPKTWNTGLLRNADLSTYLHETGHFFLEAEAALADSPNAPQKVKDDFNKALNWLGVDDAATWNGMSLEQKRPYHEKYARGFEAYLMEGKAPSQELKSLFREFASWLTHIYKQLRNLNVELSDEVRGVFDRMLASEEAILAAEQARGYEALLLGGATDAEAISYVQQGEEATRAAIEKLQQRSLRDMKWLSSKRAGVVRGLNREARDARKAVKAEVVAEVMGEPVNQAVTYLRRGEYTDEFTGEKIKADGAFRLDRAALAELGYRAEELPGMTTDNGEQPDFIASRFGFGSSEAMLSAIVNREDVGAKIEGMTDQRMLERHGDLYDERAIAAAADDAIHNDARAKFMATGLKMAMKSPLPVAQIKKAAKSAAAEVIAAKKVNALRPAEYTAAEGRANKAALKAAPKDPEAAQRAMRSALLNNQLARATLDAQAEVTAGVDRMKRLQKGAAQANMRGDYLDQLNALLARYDLRTSTKAVPADRQELRDWLQAKSEENSAVLPDVPEWVLQEADRRSYKELTVEEFRGLMTTVKGIELLARREQNQYLAIRGMQFQQERREVLDRIREFNPEAFDSNGEPLGMAKRFVPTMSKQWDDFTDAAAGQLLNSENIINLLEGGEFGVVNESLFGRMSKAADWKATRMQGVAAKMEPLMGAYNYIERRQFTSKDIVPEELRKRLGGSTEGGLTRENVVVIALLHGNREGRERLANYGWSEQTQRDIVDLLDERDVKLANGIWDLFDNDLWPELEALNKRTRGKAPPKVEAISHTAKSGELRGGYFRLKYDSDQSEMVYRAEQVSSVRELAGGTLGRGAKTAQGTSTERKEGVTLKPRFDLGVLSETVSETVHDIAYREAVMDTMRMLNDVGIQQTIKKVAGIKAYRALEIHVREVAAPPRNPTSFIGKTMSVARRNSVVALMSGVSTALINFTGFLPAMSRVSSGRLAKEVAQFYGPGMLSKIETADRLSDYMRNRSKSYERDMQDSINKMTLERGTPGIRWLPNTHSGLALGLMTMVDKGVSYPVWHAAFADGMYKFGNDKVKSVEYADHIVRQTQGSGRHVDLAAVQSGHGDWGNLKKLFTMFTSYMISMLGALTRSGAVSKQVAKRNPPLAAALFAKNFMLIYVLPAVMATLIKDAIDGEDDDTPEEKVKKHSWELARYGIGMFPVLRDVAPLYIATVVDDDAVPYYGYKMTPAQTFFEAPARGIGSAMDVAEGEGDDRDLRNILMGVGVAFHLPAKLIADTTLGAKAFLEGEAGPHAIVVGPPKK